MIWVLNSDLGMSAREAFAERPYWEVQALMRQRDERIKEEKKAERKAARSQ